MRVKVLNLEAFCEAAFAEEAALEELAHNCSACFKALLFDDFGSRRRIALLFRLHFHSQIIISISIPPNQPAKLTIAQQISLDLHR